MGEFPYVVLNGLNLSAYEPATGVQWSANTPLDGWAGPGSTINVVQKPRAHGGWAGQAYLQPRHVGISGLVSGPSQAAVADAIDRLNAAASLSGATLSVVEESGARSCTVRREDEVLAPEITPTLHRWSLQLVATDPRKYGTALSASTPLASSSGGFTFPLQFPFAINSTVVAGKVSLTNPGNVAGPVTLRIDGPVTGPIVTHVTSGQVLVFASSLVLGAGEFVTVDMERREVLAQGQSSRNGWVTSRGWSSFVPGVNTWSFSATSYDPGSLLTVTASPTWE